jgi:hypothetical protein
MRPISFAQMTGELTRPPSMTEAECVPLPVHYSSTQNAIISCWKPTISERIALLFGARVWLWVYSHSHPPVAVEVRSPFDE